MRWYLLALIVVISGCRGGREHNAADAPPVPVSNDNGENDAAAPPDEPRVPVLELGAGGEDEALEALAAVPVWEAVINRGDYLARRRKQGVIHGRVGAPVGRYIYVIDETEGWGALAVRMASTTAAALEPGQRLVVWGAWSVDDELGWYWQAQKMASLPARDSGIPPDAEAAPGLDIVTIAAPPAEAVPVSMHTRDPGYIVFEMVRMGGEPSQGWEISDRSDWQPVARLFLPGERTVYGAQDYRSPSEHWRLESGVRYVVRVDRSAAPRADALVRLTALDAPRRLGE